MEPADAGHFTTFQVRRSAAQGRDWHLNRLVFASRDFYGSNQAKGRVLRMIREALGGADPALRQACTVRVRVLPPHAGYRGDHVPPGHDDTAFEIGIDLEPPRQPPAQPLRVRSHVGLRPAPLVKHLALGYQYQARQLAREAGFDDALFLAPGGCISEGTFWNVVFWDGAQWVWPRAIALQGVTGRMLQWAMDAGDVPRCTGPVMLDGLARMRAAFAINSTGIADIAAIDAWQLPGDPAAGRTLRGMLAAVPWETI